jgi:hypothetical protein
MSDGPLTDFQLEVARLFFTLPAAQAFALGGGAGLVAAGLTERPTRDLDFLAAESVVGDARDELEGAAADQGWRTGRIRDEDTFVRLRIDGPDALRASVRAGLFRARFGDGIGPQPCLRDREGPSWPGPGRPVMEA